MSIFDTIWRRRGRPANSKAPVSLPPRKHITMTDRDYSELLEYGDVAIKFWLPDMVGIMLSQSCRFANTTRSDFIRQNLFIYLYGRYDLMGLLEQRDQYYRLDPPSRTLYSKSARLSPYSAVNSYEVDGHLLSVRFGVSDIKSKGGSRWPSTRLT